MRNAMFPFRGLQSVIGSKIKHSASMENKKKARVKVLLL